MEFLDLEAEVSGNEGSSGTDGESDSGDADGFIDDSVLASPDCSLVHSKPPFKDQKRKKHRRKFALISASSSSSSESDRGKQRKKARRTRDRDSSDSKSTSSSSSGKPPKKKKKQYRRKHYRRVLVDSGSSPSSEPVPPFPRQAVEKDRKRRQSDAPTIPPPKKTRFIYRPLPAQQVAFAEFLFRIRQ